MRTSKNSNLHLNPSALRATSGESTGLPRKAPPFRGGNDTKSPMKGEKQSSGVFLAKSRKGFTKSGF